MKTCAGAYTLLDIHVSTSITSEAMLSHPPSQPFISLSNHSQSRNYPCLSSDLPLCKRPPNLPRNPQPQHSHHISTLCAPREPPPPIPPTLRLIDMPPLHQDARILRALAIRGAKLRGINERVLTRRGGEVGRGFLQEVVRVGELVGGVGVVGGLEGGGEDFFALGADHAGCGVEVLDGGEEVVEVAEGEGAFWFCGMLAG